MHSTLSKKNLPRWNDPTLRAGTKIRTALWLLSEVGFGEIFTKEQHRQAFPGVSQADRRLRDLRASGWVIHTNLEDASLNSNEQRFVAAGAAIWDPASPKNAGTTNISQKQRRAIFAEAGYQCSVCGIAGGENYPDSPWMSAVLSIASRTLLKTDGKSEVLHIVECKRCNAGEKDRNDNVAKLVLELNQLSDADKLVLTHLINQTAGSALIKVWAQYRRLSVPGMQEVRALISKK